MSRWRRRANVAPNVSMTSPSDGASFVAGASVTFAATAADSRRNDPERSVLPGDDAHRHGYNQPVLDDMAGGRRVAQRDAVATDNQGAVTVSAWRDFIVTATALPATAKFVPASPADAVDYYVFEVFAGSKPEHGGSDRKAEHWPPGGG